jgi:para-aminobenzoate synthetase component 1
MFNPIFRYRNSRNLVYLTVANPAVLGGMESFLTIDQSFFEPESPSSGIADIIQLPSFDEKNWQFGFIAYDYKNQLESLKSENEDKFHVPPCFFMKSGLVLGRKEGKWTVIDEFHGIDKEELKQCLAESDVPVLPEPDQPPVLIRARLSREEYVRRVNEIKKKISEGEVYEVNFCQEFYAENTVIDPVLVFERLSRFSPAPFSAFCKFGDTYLISSSPERFLKKTGDYLISQPIKGTRPRGGDGSSDRKLKKELLADEKERAENVMIVDLVRNDLSRIASRGTVKVDELFGIYSFEQVHQMISTVSCSLKPGTSFAEIIRATFPMGSMTGAPKIRAMQLIEEYETTKRGLYSGALGFITPQGDFDFSVVIRSILYNADKKYLSFMVGSAITHKSDPEAEYEECLVKAKGMMKALNATLIDAPDSGNKK